MTFIFRKPVRVVFCLILLGLLPGVTGEAATTDQVDEISFAEPCRSGRVVNPSLGGDIPTPFEIFNQRVELAEDVSYLLVGRISLKPTYSMFGQKEIPVFEIDLQAQPWLANPKRVARPFYMLAGSITQWKPYDGRRVKLPAMAKSIIYRVDGSYEADIQLVLSNKAQLVELGEKSRSTTW